jgi:hypothetical protein
MGRTTSDFKWFQTETLTKQDMLTRIQTSAWMETITQKDVVEAAWNVAHSLLQADVHIAN